MHFTNLNVLAMKGISRIVENSMPLFSVHSIIGPVMVQSGEDPSFKALTRMPKTVKATVSDVYMPKRVWK